MVEKSGPPVINPDLLKVTFSPIHLKADSIAVIKLVIKNLKRGFNLFAIAPTKPVRPPPSLAISVAKVSSDNFLLNSATKLSTLPIALSLPLSSKPKAKLI